MSLLFQLSPPERSAISGVLGSLDKLSSALSQIDETLLIYDLYGKHASHTKIAKNAPKKK